MPITCVLYTIGVGYLTLVVWVIVYKATGFSRGRRLTFLLAVVLPLIAIVIQNRLPGVVLECFAASLSVLFALLTIQNSNELIDRCTGLYNRGAFFQFLQHACDRKKEFWLIVIYSRELVNFQGFLNIHTYEQIVRAFTGWLSSIAGKVSLICKLEDGMFALLNERALHGPLAGEKIALALAQRSDERWGVEGLDVEVPLSITLLRYSRDCADVPDVLDRIDQLIDLPEKRENRHISYAMDFKPDKRPREASIALAIEAGLQAGAPELKYQPMYSVNEQRITALEVLVFVSLGGETVEQGEVLRIAEGAGLGRLLFDRTLARACSVFTTRELAARGIDRLQIRLLESKCIEVDWPQSILSIAGPGGIARSKRPAFTGWNRIAVQTAAVPRNRQRNRNRGAGLQADRHGFRLPARSLLGKTDGRRRDPRPARGNGPSRSRQPMSKAASFSRPTTHRRGAAGCRACSRPLSGQNKRQDL